MCAVALPDGGVLQKDWATDSNGKESLDYDQFFESLFELIGAVV